VRLAQLRPPMSFIVQWPAAVSVLLPSQHTRKPSNSRTKCSVRGHREGLPTCLTEVIGYRAPGLRRPCYYCLRDNSSNKIGTLCKGVFRTTCCRVNTYLFHAPSVVMSVESVSEYCVGLHATGAHEGTAGRNAHALPSCSHVVWGVRCGYWGSARGDFVSS
jgi:hypothetical protein